MATIDLGKVVPEKGIDYFTDADIEEIRQGMQLKIDATNKVNSDFISDTNQTNKFVSAQDKINWNAKQDALVAGDNIVIEGNTISATGQVYGDTIQNLTGDTNVWELDSGVYKAHTTGNIYLDPNDLTVYIPVTGHLFMLVVDKLGTDVVRFYLFGESLIAYGISSNVIVQPTSITYCGVDTFTGTDGLANGTTGTVPAPQTTDDGKFLCADGTWQAVNAGPTPIVDDTNIWQLTAGTYSIGLDNQYYFYLYYDPSDNTKKIQITNVSILVVDINTNSDTVYFSLYEGTEQIVSGEIDPNGVFSPVINNVSLHISTISTADIDFLFA